MFHAEIQLPALSLATVIDSKVSYSESLTTEVFMRFVRITRKSYAYETLHLDLYVPIVVY